MNLNLNLSRSAALVFFAISFYAAAQSPEITKLVAQSKSILDTSRSLSGFQQAAQSLEAITVAGKNDWLVWYYISFSHAMLGFYTKADAEKDALYEKAMLEALRADSLSPNNSEVFTLKGMVYQLQVQVSPIIRGQLVFLAGSMLDKAIELNPENPRPYYLKGQGFFYTPSLFGGGKEKALPYLQQAVDKFAATRSSSPIMPDWGSQRASQLLAECKKNK